MSARLNPLRGNFSGKFIHPQTGAPATFRGVILQKQGAGFGYFAAGSDTAAFERVPAPDMPVHVHLLVERGIHILECLNLEELAAAGVREFLFIAAPLRIEGATGSPIRPLALVPEPRP